MKFLKESVATTKGVLLEQVITEHRRINQCYQIDFQHSSAFYHVLDKLYCKLEECIQNTRFLGSLEEGWFYYHSVDLYGASVKLAYIDFSTHGNYVIEQEFCVVQVKANFLSVTNYSKLYNVEAGTVRQWIRRGKIRSALKYGNEWLIPELSDLCRKRGYEPAFYRWYGELDNLPENYLWLNKYRKVHLQQSRYEGKLFVALFYDSLSSEIPTLKMAFDTNELQSFELFLIAHLQIEYIAPPLF